MWYHEMRHCPGFVCVLPGCESQVGKTKISFDKGCKMLYYGSRKRGVTSRRLAPYKNFIAEIAVKFCQDSGGYFCVLLLSLRPMAYPRFFYFSGMFSIKKETAGFFMPKNELEVDII